MAGATRSSKPGADIGDAGVATDLILDQLAELSSESDVLLVAFRLWVERKKVGRGCGGYHPGRASDPKSDRAARPASQPLKHARPGGPGVTGSVRAVLSAGAGLCGPDHPDRTEAQPDCQAKDSPVDRCEDTQTTHRTPPMQDIAGCRLIVEDVLEQEEVLERLLQLPWEASQVDDRRLRPSHGYRAGHVIVTAVGHPVEIQIRTALQDRWAQISEKMAAGGGERGRPQDHPRPLLQDAAGAGRGRQYRLSTAVLDGDQVRPGAEIVVRANRRR